MILTFVVAGSEYGNQRTPVPVYQIKKTYVLKH